MEKSPHPFLRLSELERTHGEVFGYVNIIIMVQESL